MFTVADYFEFDMRVINAIKRENLRDTATRELVVALRAAGK